MQMREGPRPSTFSGPAQLPRNVAEEREWQEANRLWWEHHPMQYDWAEAIPYEKFSREYFREVDRRFFESSRFYLPWRKYPFEALVDFEGLAGMKVLEIGVGCGSHAQLLAQHAAEFVGLDITEHAVRATQARINVMGISKASILQVDAQRMPFPDNSFDLVWSWGVIHHSADTDAVLREICRVLKPGGRMILMVYHRGWWNYYVVGGLILGLCCGQLFRHKSVHRIIQNRTDGALARYYSLGEWKRSAPKGLVLDKAFVLGMKTDLVPLPRGRIRDFLLTALPDSVGRFMVRALRMGSFLVSTHHKE